MTEATDVKTPVPHNDEKQSFERNDPVRILGYTSFINLAVCISKTAFRTDVLFTFFGLALQPALAGFCMDSLPSYRGNPSSNSFHHKVSNNTGCRCTYRWNAGRVKADFSALCDFANLTYQIPRGRYGQRAFPSSTSCPSHLDG